MLQTNEAEFRQRRLLCRQRGDAVLAQLPVGSEAAPQVELGCIIRQAGDPDGFDLALRKRLAEAAEIRLQTAHHDRLEFLRADVNAACEPLRV